MLNDELCYGYHVWVVRRGVEECSRCGQINVEPRGTSHDDKA